MGLVVPEYSDIIKHGGHDLWLWGLSSEGLLASGTLLLPFPLGETWAFPLNKPLNRVTFLNLGSSLRSAGFHISFHVPQPQPLSIKRHWRERPTCWWGLASSVTCGIAWIRKEKSQEQDGQNDSLPKVSNNMTDPCQEMPLDGKGMFFWVKDTCRLIECDQQHGGQGRVVAYCFTCLPHTEQGLKFTWSANNP